MLLIVDCTVLCSIAVCRYFIRVTISRRIADVTKEKDLWVHSFRMPPDSNNSIKMEVGIEDCLHIEFEYNKSKYVAMVFSDFFSLKSCCRYHLKDVIVGKIYFLLVRIKIKHMELSIIRRETTGSPPQSIQWKRDHHQVRNYGWRTRTRYVHEVLSYAKHLTFPQARQYLFDSSSEALTWPRRSAMWTRGSVCDTISTSSLLMRKTGDTSSNR